jgi:hypothetical protein
MVPAGFFRLETLPLTSNGKIDRKRLEQTPVEFDAGEHYAAPQTPVERQLAHIWEHVLDVERVGLSDNFFDIGGYSLLSIQLVHQINQQLPSPSIGIVDIIQYPTLRNLPPASATPAANRPVRPMSPVCTTAFRPSSFRACRD